MYIAQMFCGLSLSYMYFSRILSLPQRGHDTFCTASQQIMNVSWTDEARPKKQLIIDAGGNWDQDVAPEIKKKDNLLSVE